MLVSHLRAVRLFPRTTSVRRWQTSLASGAAAPASGDVLVTALNGAQDISVKAVSCREVVQEAILRNDLSPQAGHALAEVMACTLMMGSGYKDEETLQVNIVGTAGMKNVMAISDGKLKVRGMVGNPRFTTGGRDGSPRTRELFGEEGQIQIVRNHPTWKAPQVGIVALRDTSISLNLALYMTESEQRSAFILTDVCVEGNLCRHALAVCVERLPGCTEENVESSVSNLEKVERKGLRSYLDRTDEERKNDVGEFRDFTPALEKILDDCIGTMNEGELRWSKTPQFRCSCGIEKVWRTLRLLPKTEVRSILDEEVNKEGIEFGCEFCGTKYKLAPSEVEQQIFGPSSADN